MNFPAWRHRVVRELAWSVFGPALLRPLTAEPDHSPALTAHRRAWLDALDADPAPLRAHLARLSSTRLGLRFEALWTFFIAADPDYRLLAHNLPVRDGGHTLGAFDLLYRQDSTPFHAELAVKFYLGDPVTGAWLGPNCRDRLAAKVSHLQTRQLRLRDTAPAQAAWRELAPGSPRPRPWALTRGCLFYPWQRTLSPPPLAAPGHWWGYWCKQEDWPDVQAGETTGDDRWLLLAKPHWLAPAWLAERELRETPGEQRPLTRDELATALAQQDWRQGHYQMVAHLQRDGLGDWREVARYVLTSADWPWTT